MPFTPTVSDHWITHPQGRLFARQWAPPEGAETGVPLVLLHDSLGCIELWRGFPELLSRTTGRRVVAYDRMGFGRSDARPARPSHDFVAEEARLYLPHVREQLGVGRFAVLGHSVGGGMAINVAATTPECEALISIAAQTFVEDKTLDGVRAARVQFSDPAQVDRISRYHGPKADWVLDAWIGTWLDPEFAGWTLNGVLAQITCPALAIHGEDDEFGSPAHALRVGEHSRGPVQTDILPATGHVPHREQPDAMAQRIARFLAG